MMIWMMIRLKIRLNQEHIVFGVGPRYYNRYYKLRENNLDEIVERKDYQTLRTMLRGMEEVSGEEEKPDQGRFRGSQREKLSTDDAAEAGGTVGAEVKKGESEEIPKEYAECFGILNGQKEECEECPKKIWKECLKLTEESKKANKEPERKFRRGLDK